MRQENSDHRLCEDKLQQTPRMTAVSTIGLVQAGAAKVEVRGKPLRLAAGS
jgi:hypothetical protein